jgi:type VI secretion system protein ImpK
MEQEYGMNIENWVHSIIELEEDQDNHRPHDTGSHQPLISLSPPTYYRSKAFSSSIGINSLINAADPLLTLVTKLRRITIPPEAALLHQNICHEIKAFENKTQTAGYRQPIILAAKYTLCALLDELVAITLWPDREWKKLSLIDTFQTETCHDDRFFLILERSLQDPPAHIDFLELVYLCLRLGYEGKYRGIDRGHLELRAITDHLYAVIMQCRDEFSRGLLISLENPNYSLVRKKSYLHLLPSAWAICTAMVLLLLFLFSYFYMRLMDSALPITRLINSLQVAQDLNDIKVIAK